jgi:cytochrome c peroxidase
MLLNNPVFPALALFLGVLSLFTSCGNKQEEFSLDIPQGWPKPEIPEDKQLTESRILLGRKLFYDPILSRNGDVSCASCHKPGFAFADSVAVSAGTHAALGNRNTPSLFNVTWYPHFFAEGGVPNLELVVVGPIQNDVEMGFNLAEACNRLARDAEYVRLFKKAYDTLPSTYTLVRALGAFQRTLISGNAPYDRFLRGDSSALSASARKGFSLFFSDKMGCGKCHSGFLFTDFSFHNLGLNSETDPGRYRLTSNPSDKGKFRTPSLRNVAITAPYMHNGSLSDLESVIDFYAKGGGDDANKSDLLRVISITSDEKRDLISFLESLTDSSALKNPDYLPLK